MEVLAGGLAASVACIFTNPLEVVKNRLQLQAIAGYEMLGDFLMFCSISYIRNMAEHDTRESYEPKGNM